LSRTDRVEHDCPKGEQAIEWYLVTNEPIGTTEQVAAIVDAYRARWVIEELFKALKTGCQIEKRQLESYEALRNALALFLPIAVGLGPEGIEARMPSVDGGRDPSFFDEFGVNVDVKRHRPSLADRSRRRCSAFRAGATSGQAATSALRGRRLLERHRGPRRPSRLNLVAWPDMGDEARAWASLESAWALSARLHSLQPAATNQELDAFEAESGIRLPTEWRRLYRHANGGDWLEGNLRFYPLTGDTFSLTQASAAHVAWHWTIPNELLLAGDNGAGLVFGLWLPSRNAETGAVVQTGEIFEPRCLAVAATSLTALLLARTAYYLLLLEASEALEVLHLPAALRTSNPDEETWLAILKWVDPGRPTSSDDPYSARLDVAQVNAALRGAG
jgi:hypothetical protein